MSVRNEHRGRKDVVVSFDCPPKIGGAHLWLYEVYRRWQSPVQWLAARNSDAVDAVAGEMAFDASSHGPPTISRAADPLHRIEVLSFQTWRAFMHNVMTLRRMIGESPVRLHALRAFPEGFSALLYKTLRFRGAHLVTYAHGEEILIARTSGQLKLMARRVYAGSDLVIANSENTRRIVLELCPRARVVVIHPGVDVSAFMQTPQAIATTRSAWGWPADTLVLTTVARMEARKNQAAVLRAMAMLRTQGLSIGYVCAGDGPERASLIALAEELQLQSWVRFPGAVSDQEKKQIFASADVHIMPSIQIGEMIEGFGIVFLEAAAAGIPSIAGASGGQSEAVCEGVTGIVVRGESTSAIADAIRTLAEDPVRRREMGKSARRRVADQDWDRVVARTVQAVSLQLPG